jgi:hypothetical protein
MPIEIVIVIAINLVVGVAGYYAIMMWGLFRSWRHLSHQAARITIAVREIVMDASVGRDAIRIS